VLKKKPAALVMQQTVQGDALTTARDPNPIAGLIGKVAGVSVGPSAELLGNPNVLIRVTLFHYML
jgi:hypothetical protein